MADSCKETVKYTRIWEDGKLPTCKRSKSRAASLRKKFKRRFSKSPTELEVVEIVGPSGRRHAICGEIEKRVFIDVASSKAPRTSLYSIHWHMIKRYRLAMYDLL